MNIKSILLVVIFLLSDKTVSQDVSLNDRKSFDNSSGTIDLDVDVRGTPGPQGPKGEQGPKGSTGERGLKGDPGMKGEKGLPGDIGPTGTTGRKGDSGARGQKGERGGQGLLGPVGPSGPAGLPGPQGDPGPQGPPGPFGRSGLPGPQGSKGQKGEHGRVGLTGPVGPPGPAGPQGRQGDAGPLGDTGPIGTTGNKGETGGKGQKGSRGIQGPIGPTGRQGLPGPQGIQGEPGDTVLNREEFDRVCKVTVKKINESIIVDLVDENKKLKKQVTFLEQQHGNVFCSIRSGNWRRIAYFDTTRRDPCPLGLRTFTNTTTGQRACGTTDEGRQQRSLKFSTGGSYTHVCGRVRGYHGGPTVAFYHHGQRSQTMTIDTNYVDGVSITKGTPRQHLWTYAAGLSETHNRDYFACPCARLSYNPSWIPSFVGSNFYCESGFVGPYVNRIVWEDPLWDGKGCFATDNTCCHHYGWFHRQVQPTTDDIEVRWSKYYTSGQGAEILTDQLEIWVM